MNVARRQTQLGSTTVALLTLLACTAESEPGSTAPKEPAPDTQHAHPAPPPTLQGHYFRTHEVYWYDDTVGDDVLGPEDTDLLRIEKAPRGALKVRIHIVAHNYDLCYFDDAIMTESGPHQWRWKGGDTHPNCEVLLVKTPTAIVITSNWDCKDEFCGHRATLEGTFPMESQVPLGSYEWPGM